MRFRLLAAPSADDKNLNSSSDFAFSAACGASSALVDETHLVGFEHDLREFFPGTETLAGVAVAEIFGGVPMIDCAGAAFHVNGGAPHKDCAAAAGAGLGNEIDGVAALHHHARNFDGSARLRGAVPDAQHAGAAGNNDTD